MAKKSGMRKDDVLRVLVRSEDKEKIQDMYADQGVNLSEDTRNYWLRKLAKYEAAK